MDNLQTQNTHDSEFIKFEAHENIVDHLIDSQNGTVSTSIKELVLNAIDKGSKKCDIKINQYSFTVSDWGSGFESEHDIRTNFKNFGQPHVEGDAIHGRFRIGRGQIIALAATTWTSHNFTMATDKRNKGSGFQFTKHPDSLWDGCRVDGTFYNPISNHDMYLLESELKHQLKYVDIEIILNNTLISSDIKHVKWDIDDGDIKIQFMKSADGVQIYSQGAFVKNLRSHHYSFDAVVFTSKALKLNMARNEVSDSDPLWIRVSQHLQDHANELAKRKGKSGRIDVSTRRMRIRIFNNATMVFKDVLDMCFIKDTRGHSISLRMLANSKLPLTLQSESDFESTIKKAESIATRRLAQVLSFDVHNEFGVTTIEEFLNKLCNTIDRLYSDDDMAIHIIDGLLDRKRIDFNDVANKLISESTLVPKGKLNKRETIARNAIQHGSNLMSRELSKYFGKDVLRRNILIGESDVADAWTNGSDTIVIAKHVLPYLDTLSRAGGFQLANLLLHEYLHDADDQETHEHDFEFYQAFHDCAADYRLDAVGTVGVGLYNKYLTLLSNSCHELPKPIHNEFKYPIVNNTCTYKLAMSQEKPTQLFKTIMEWLGLPFKQSKGHLIIIISRDKVSPREFFEFFYNLLKRNQYEIPPYEFYRDSYDSSKKAISTFNNKVAEGLEILLPFKVSKAFLLMLAEASNIEQVFTALTSTSESGITYISTPHVVSSQHTFSHKTNYHHAIVDGFYGSRWGDDRFLQTHSDYTDFAATQKGRLKYASQIIEHAFLGLKDENERKELADLLLSTDGKSQLMSVFNMSNQNK